MHAKHILRALASVFVLIAGVASLSTPPPVADRVGLRVAITDKGLKYASKVALPLLLSELSTISIPDIPFDKSGFTGSVSSIKCKDVAINSLDLNANVVESLALAADGMSLSCSANWKYKLKSWPHVPSGHGTVSISIGDDSAFSATLDISNNTGVFTSISLPSCASNVKVSGLHFSGGLSGDILNLFKSLIKSVVQKELNSQVCSSLQTAIANDLNPVLAEKPARFLAATVLGRAVVCDLSFGVNSSAAGPSPIQVPSLPVPDPNVAPTHELLAMFDMVPFNYLMNVVYDAGLLDVIITNDMLPASFPNVLNTSNLQTIAPDMYKMWPNDLMQIEVNASSAPLFDVKLINHYQQRVSTTKNTELEAVVPADFVFQVLDPKTGLNDAFTVHCPFTLGVSVSVEKGVLPGQQTVNASVPELKCNLKEKISHVGNVSMVQLQGLVSLAEGIVLPMLNAKLKNLSITIPSLGPVNLTNSEIGFETESPGYMLVATDIVMPNTTATGGVQSAVGDAVWALHNDILSGGDIKLMAKSIWKIVFAPLFRIPKF